MAPTRDRSPAFNGRARGANACASARACPRCPRALPPPRCRGQPCPTGDTLPRPMDHAREPLLRPLGAGMACGVFAGLATGAIDAVWSWAPSAQFLPGVMARLRCVAFAATSYALAGAGAGLVAAAVLVSL